MSNSSSLAVNDGVEQLSSGPEAEGDGESVTVEQDDLSVHIMSNEEDSGMSSEVIDRPADHFSKECAVDQSPPHPCHQSSSLPDIMQAESDIFELKSVRSQTTDAFPGNNAVLAVGQSEIPIEERHMSSTSFQSVCRICQLNRCDTDEELVSAGCHCRGGLEKCHRSCLVEWALRRNSNRCEICCDLYADIPPPGLGVLDVRERHLAAWCLDVQECTRHRRPCLYFLCCVLFAIAGICGYLTARMQALYQETLTDWRSTESDMETTRFLFGFCVFMLAFCITLAVGVSSIWLSIELASYCRRYTARRDTRRRHLRRQLLRQGSITIEEFFRLDSEWRMRAILAQHPSAEVV